MGLVWVIYYRSNYRNGILMLGLCESGKSLLFSQLVHNKFIPSFTSIKENSGPYQAPKKGVLHILDLPGHERLRGKYFDDFKPIARAIIFVIDSVSIQKDLRDVADFLYNILTDSTITKQKPPMLLLCNKQDQMMAKSANVVRGMLEREINTLRSTQTKQLSSTEGTSNAVFLGKANKEFEFSQLSYFKISVEECSASAGENTVGISNVTKWLDRIA